MDDLIDISYSTVVVICIVMHVKYVMVCDVSNCMLIQSSCTCIYFLFMLSQ